MVAPDFGNIESAVTDNDEAGSASSLLNRSETIAEANETTLPDFNWKSLTSMFSPWSGSNAPAFADTIPAAARPLSVAARQHWSCVMVTKHAVRRGGIETSSAGPAAAEQETPLSTFPATEERLRELL